MGNNVGVGSPSSEYGDTCGVEVTGDGVWKGLSPLFGKSGSSLVTDALLSLRPCLGFSADVSELADSRRSSDLGRDVGIDITGVEWRRESIGLVTCGLLTSIGKTLLRGGLDGPGFSGNLTPPPTSAAPSTQSSPAFPLDCGLPPNGERRLPKFGNTCCWKRFSELKPCSKLVRDLGPGGVPAAG